MKNLVIAALLGISLVGCATLEALKEPVDYDSTYKRVTFTTDNYKGTRTYKSPILTINEGKNIDNELMMGYLTFTKANDGSELYCLMTTYDSKNWAFFKTAYDINQKELPVINGSRNVGSMFNDVLVTENNCIQLSKKYLKDASMGNGLNIKLIGEKKQKVIKIGAYYVKAFLDAVSYSETTRFSKNQ
ncbi:hypothetical protein [Acinetobacter pittii]|jgi:hypothetical protein|uniref:hypothetical protein n=1 Tax=Acinetobacter pittii TaxID=48296 RepID=UPI000E5B79EE|nr:hypothetical protein [Acinetobacter pittii]